MIFSMKCQQCNDWTPHECRLIWKGEGSRPDVGDMDVATMLKVFNECICTACHTPKEHITAHAYFTLMQAFLHGDESVMKDA